MRSEEQNVLPKNSFRNWKIVIGNFFLLVNYDTPTGSLPYTPSHYYGGKKCQLIYSSLAKNATEKWRMLNTDHEHLLGAKFNWTTNKNCHEGYGSIIFSSVLLIVLKFIHLRKRKSCLLEWLLRCLPTPPPSSVPTIPPPPINLSIFSYSSHLSFLFPTTLHSFHHPLVFSLIPNFFTLLPFPTTSIA